MPTEINEDLNHQVTVILLKRIIELLEKEESEPPESLKGDEVRAALRNELGAVVKSIKALPDNSDIVAQLKKLENAFSKIEFSPSINVAAADVTIPTIELPTINVPEINIPTINVPTPQVNYTAPDIHIPAPVVNLPAPVVNVEATDLSAIIRALEVNLNKLRTNGETRPLAVRMSDGQKWVKELQELNKTAASQVQYLSDVSYIKDSVGNRINPATLEGQNLNRVSTLNSTTIALNAGATFTGGWEDVSQYNSVVIAAATDQNSTCTIQFSPDGTNADSTLTCYYKTTAINPPHRYTITRKYMRITFTNTSSTNQTYLRLQAIYGNHNDLNLPTDAPMPQSFDATVVRPTDYALDVVKGNVGGVAYNNKFGRNGNTATGDAIWAVSTAYAEPASAELCNVVSTSIEDDFGGGTGAGKITIIGVNDSYDVVTEVVELNGTSNVSTVNKYWNIHRAYVSTKAPSGTDAGAVGTITITSTAAGTPVISQLAIGYNQTQSTVYMVPRGHTAYINRVKLTGQNTSSTATCDIGLFKKDFGGVFRVQSDFNLTGGATAYIQKEYGAPLKFDAKSTVLFKAVAVSGAGTWDVAVDYDVWLVTDQS